MAKSESVQSSVGFPPVAAADARFLILGSLPGQRSLELTQYYAHRQNAFWRIMEELFGVEGDYQSRCRQLMVHRIAVWDVLAESVRPGSMDADIQLESARTNDFAGFLSDHGQIRRICFNGRKAEALFTRYVISAFPSTHLEFVSLPSTSPAYAAMSFAEKRDVWAAGLGLSEENPGGRRQ